ncbi:MAG: HD domain-containing protein [Candidatus Zambryskibacteria bacterium]|nr:HD domain-containing protein [Candidatus Zambryskibacteria bacterium]
MKNSKFKFNLPEEVRKISQTLSTAGFENYLVGGSIRDLVTNRVPKDWDVATSATPEKIQKIFPDSFYENKFGTVGVKTSIGIVEITPYRLESSYSDARHPDKVKWAKTIEEDLARRDFTINALAYNIESEELLDPFGGLKDIENKVIKTVDNPDDRFNEDALRMFRALRLASELNFAIELETQSAITKNAELTAKISRERIRDELVKIVLSDYPALALELSARLGLLKFISPEFEKGIGMKQNQAHAYTVWEHLLRTLEHSARKKYPLYVRLASFFHDIGKPHTKGLKGNTITFYGHEVVGAKLTKNIFEELKFPKDLTEQAVKLVRWHMFFSDPDKITLSAVRRIVRNVGPELIWDLVNLRVCDRIGTGRPKETPFRLRKYKSMIEEVLRDPITVKQLSLGGVEVMQITETGPGPHVGFILEILLSEVLENPKLNTKECLEKRVQELYKLKLDELTKLGREARVKNESEEEKEISKIREEYKVN